ncbi:MAG: alanine transaminase [Epsilonproteobacteria bacterium]|jgi:alanine-synthesizing transaminase|nr:alanine transaminase [Campylobacterota bacterium]NPA89693.1 LL-diaminopimelate aminotransferase [Campylobacterota bacterium]
MNTHFERIERLPDYIFAVINDLKLQARRAGEDIIDFSMGNPDGPTPKPIVDKLIETARKPKNHRYSISKGIYRLREAICNWYARRYNVSFDPETEAVATMGSKEGYVHFAQAVTNVGDVVVVPDPTYPIHSYAFVLAGANVRKVRLPFNPSTFELEEEKLLESIKVAVKEALPKPKFIILNFPHNPTTVTTTLNFYQKIVDFARKEGIFLISDIAYADITFDGYKTPSIFQAEGAKEVAVESFTLSKSFNMAGWRVGFMVGNRVLIQALQKYKSWIDYGMFTPIQVAATVALRDYSYLVEEIVETYRKRRDVLIESFGNAGWHLEKPKATMFVWAKIPEPFQKMGSLEFSKRLLTEAHIAVSPGVGFGPYGEGYVRIALIENEKRIRQAAKNVKKFLKGFKNNG